MEVVSDLSCRCHSACFLSGRAAGVLILCLQRAGGPPPHPTCGSCVDAMIVVTVEDEEAEGFGFHAWRWCSFSASRLACFDAAELVIWICSISVLLSECVVESLDCEFCSMTTLLSEGSGG
ncbi:hypothetical protein Dimus_001088, partial [Dionaea muscipula]